MECPVCGKRIPRTDVNRFCDRCGSRLVDDERESYLRDRLDELEVSLGELERMKVEGGIDTAYYLPTVAEMEEEISRLAAELAASEQTRRDISSQWAVQKLDEAESLLRAGMTLQARELAKQVVMLKPAYPTAHHVMAMVLYQEGRIEEAIRATRYAHSLDPSNGRIDEYLRFLEARYYESNRRQDTADYVTTQQRTFEPRRTPPAQRPPRQYRPPQQSAAPRPPKPPQQFRPQQQAATPRPPRPPKPPKPPKPPRQMPDFSGWVKDLIDRGFLKWWYFVGTFIMLAGILGLVTWQWGRVGKYFVFAVALAANAGLYFLGHYLKRKEINLGSTIIFVIASALVPLNIYLFNRSAIAGRSFPFTLLGIAGTVIAAAIYGINYYRTRDEALLAFTAATPLALLYFILRSSGASVHYYGLWFVGLSAGYFTCGYMLRRSRLLPQSKIMYGLGNGAIILALLSTLGDYRYFIGDGFRTSGILLGSAAAALMVGSYMYEDKILAYISSAMIVIASYFVVQQPTAMWYKAAPGLTVAAGALLVIGFVDSRFIGRHEGKPFAHVGLVTLLGVFLVLAAKDLVFNLPQAWRTVPLAEQHASLITALMIAALLWGSALTQKKKYLGYLASAAMIYASLIFLGSQVTSLPLWCLAEATVVAGVLLAGGFALEKTMGEEWGLTAYIPGFTVAAVSTVAATIFYLPVISRGIIPQLALYDKAYLAVSITALVTTMYLVVAAVRSRHPHWLYGAMATAIIAYAVQAHAASHLSWVRELSVRGVNYGMLMLPLAVIFVGAAYVLKKADYEDLSWPLFAAAGAVSVFCFISQFCYLYFGPSAAVAITFGAFAVLLAVETVVWRRGELLYPAIVSVFMLGGELIGLTLPGAGIEMNYMLFLTPIAAALLVGGLLLVRKHGDNYSLPMLLSAGVFTAGGLVYQAVLAARGFEYSVYIYLFVWSVVGVVAAMLAARNNSQGWKSTLPELLVSFSLAHLALGTGYACYVYSHSFDVVCFGLIGLGAALAVIYVSAAGHLPKWLERPLSLGMPVVAVAAITCSIVNPGWRSFDANVISVLLLALDFVVIGLVSGQRLFHRFALGTYTVATVASFWCFVHITGRFAPHYALTWQCGSLAIMAALAFVSAELYQDILDHAAGYLFALPAWIGLGLILNKFPVYAGYWLVAPAVIAFAISFIEYTRKLEGHAAAGWVASIALFTVAMAYPIAIKATGQAIVTMSVALAAGVACVVMYKDDRLVHIPLSISVLETVYILGTVRPPIRPALIGFILMAPAAVYLVAGWLLARHRERLSEILLMYTVSTTALATAFTAYGLFVQHERSVLIVSTLFAIGTIYACIGIIRRYLFMGHVSFAYFFAGYVLMLANGHVGNPHLYFLPMGIYLIALGYLLEYLEYDKRTVRILQLVGFTTIALSSFIPSLTQHGGFQAIVLLSESLAAIVVGVWQRRTVFLGAGLAFIVVDGVVSIWSPVSSLHWSIYAIFVGSLVIIAGIILETKREMIVENGRAWVGQLKLWK